MGTLNSFIPHISANQRVSISSGELTHPRVTPLTGFPNRMRAWVGGFTMIQCFNKDIFRCILNFFGV